MVKSLMIQGTGSGVGKSLIVTALCRIFKDMGIDVAPFKAQNMALNSYVTLDAGEIGRAQALQALAAKLEPVIDMNPVLLKPSNQAEIQVIIHGKVYATMNTKKYFILKKHSLDAIRSSFDRLSSKHELIILEGAGSPAEINLMKNDIVNMRMAQYANAPVLLVGDIDRGGLFASFYGTVTLLGKKAKRIKAFVVNKFRGDKNFLTPALSMIKKKTGKPVIGVIPYMSNISLPEEDGVSLKEIQNSRFNIRNSSQDINAVVHIVVVKLNYISNFTDFDPFNYEPDVEMIYSCNPSEIEHADIVIIPGTKNTMDDLMYLKSTGLIDSIKRSYKKGIQIIGICGGYQMLGKKLFNPYGIEGNIKRLDGIGLLNIQTIFGKDKIVSQVEAEIIKDSESGLFSCKGIHLKGYEIHHGTSTGDVGLFKLKRNLSQSESMNCYSEGAKQLKNLEELSTINEGKSAVILDGSVNHNCWGTYIHGIFENNLFRRHILNQIRLKNRLKPLHTVVKYEDMLNTEIDLLADTVRQNISIKFIKRLLG